MDWVYPTGGDPEVIKLSFEYPEGSNETIIADGENLILNQFQAGVAGGGTLLLLWLIISAGCWSWVAWDAQRYSWSPAARQFTWPVAALLLGPIGLILYLRSRSKTQRREQPDQTAEAAGN